MLKNTFKWLLISAMAAFGAGSAVAADEAAPEWDLLIPNGVVEQEQIAPAPRLDTLDGKTIVLRWNSKENGDVVLNYLAERLAKDFPNTKLIKQYEVDESLTAVSANAEDSLRVAETLKNMGADIVLASQAD